MYDPYSPDEPENPYPWPHWGNPWEIPAESPTRPLGWDDPYLPDPYARP